jgi:glutaredoxin
MENLNEKVTNTQNDVLSKSNQELAKLKQSEKVRRTGKEILKKYFVPRSDREIFRILPPKSGKKVIEEAFFHVVTTTTTGNKKKYGTIIYCPAHNDPMVKKTDKNGQIVLDEKNLPVMIPAPCPLCKKSKDLLSTQDPLLRGVSKEKSKTLSDAEKVIYEKNSAIFKESSGLQAKKFYIIRGIDKGVQKDGVKFWRFKHNFQNKGTLNTLLPALSDFNEINNTDYTNVQNGTDLSISTVETTSNSGIKYRAVVGISARGKSLLSDDPTLIKDWINDNITWREVFIPKQAPGITSYEYLEMVAKGTNPYWDDSDSNNKHWVFPGRPDLELAANTRNAKLDADNNENFEMASDLMDEEYPSVSINNSTPEKVGTSTVINDVVNVDKNAINEITTESEPESEPEPEPESNELGEKDEYSDLPF